MVNYVWYSELHTIWYLSVIFNSTKRFYTFFTLTDVKLNRDFLICDH